MKKAFLLVILIICILSCVFVLTACNPENKIVGTYKVSSIDLSYGDNTFSTRFDYDCTITFNDDGTVTNSYNQTAYWKYDKSTKEYIIADKFDELDGDDVECAKFIDDVLHIDVWTYREIE